MVFEWIGSCEKKGFGGVSSIYLGEDGSPDGLNLLDLSGGQESLELVGLLRAKADRQFSSFRVCRVYFPSRNPVTSR